MVSGGSDKTWWFGLRHRCRYPCGNVPAAARIPRRCRMPLPATAMPLPATAMPLPATAMPLPATAVLRPGRAVPRPCRAGAAGR